MSYTFTKLFSSITSSTVWMEPAGTRLAWIAMLANCDRKGRVFGSLPGFAHLARITLEEAEIAMRTFLAPDKHSRTPAHEGRRIEEIEGGWQLLNYAYYRGIRDEESLREAKRDHMRRVRESGTTDSTDSTVDPGGTKQKQKQRQKKKAVGSKEPRASLRAKPIVVPEILKAAWSKWDKYRNGTKGWTADGKALNLSKMVELTGSNADLAGKIVDQSIERGWTGLFPLRVADDRNPAPTPQPKAKSAKEALASTETPLQRALGHIEQQYRLGAYGEGELGIKNRDNAIKTAKVRHG